MGHSVTLQQFAWLGCSKTPLVLPLNEQFNGDSPDPEEDEQPTVHVALPPAVEEPASSHISTLRNASAKASAGLKKCLFHSACRTASQFSIFWSLDWPLYSSPLSLASLIFHTVQALPVDFLVHLHRDSPLELWDMFRKLGVFQMAEVHEDAM